ncbi:MAG: hypothetical protein JKY40_10620 [Gammaproteobacteria bacterium]|nr:hypothetical protein [Gammaproteobacteria bacterium]MBL4729739.1 hypothetical protein [Gammaproteobacteria bacterium]
MFDVNECKASSITLAMSFLLFACSSAAQAAPEIDNARGCLVHEYEKGKIVSIKTFGELRLQLPFIISSARFSEPEWQATIAPGNRIIWISGSQHKYGRTSGLTILDNSNVAYDFVLTQNNEPGHSCIEIVDSEARFESVVTAAQIARTPNHKCGAKFEFQKGMLYENLNRGFEQCGFALGHWHIGNAEYFIDMPVKNPYSLNIEMGVTDILNVAEQLYGIVGTVNKEERTVDIFRNNQSTERENYE